MNEDLLKFEMNVNFKWKEDWTVKEFEVYASNKLIAINKVIKYGLKNYPWYLIEFYQVTESNIEWIIIIK